MANVNKLNKAEERELEVALSETEALPGDADPTLPAVGEDLTERSQQDEAAISEVEPDHEHRFEYKPSGIGTSMVEQCVCGKIRGR